MVLHAHVVAIFNFSISRLLQFLIFTFPTPFQLCLCQVKQDFGDKTVALQALLQTLRHILTQIGTFSLQNETHSHSRPRRMMRQIFGIHFSVWSLVRNVIKILHKKMLSCTYDHTITSHTIPSAENSSLNVHESLL